MNSEEKVGTPILLGILSWNIRGLRTKVNQKITMMKKIIKFNKVNEEKLHVFTPIEQEFRMFSKKWGIAGTLDILFHMDSNSNYYVGDWKTNKAFTTDEHSKGRRGKMLAPFEDLWDNSLNGYSLQISTYRLMLEEAGFETAGGFLIWIGPEEPKLYKALDLRDRIREHLGKNNFSL